VSIQLTRGIAGLCAVLALASCHDTSEPTGPSAPAEAMPPLPAQDPSNVQALLARSVPGFGGLFLDEASEPTVYLTDVSQRDLARRALAGVAEAQGLDVARLRVRQGEFSYRQLDGWFRRASPRVLALPGMVWADLDEASNRVTIAVENPGAASQARALLAQLGVPSGAVRFEEAEPIRYAATLRSRVRPVQGGLQINFGNFLCTLGFNATRNGVASYITNSHCTDVQGGMEGTQHFQQDRFRANTLIGTEASDPAYFTGGECPAGRRCRYSDSSRGAYASGVSRSLGRIARTTARGKLTGSITISTANPFFTINSERANPLVGQTVNKIGRTTGWTFGKITNTCVTTNVGGTDITQLCQSLVSAGVGGGDSGSPVFNWNGSGGNVRLAGILWGGSGNSIFVFSPMSGIERELGALTTF
jgi:hypothetical protein